MVLGASTSWLNLPPRKGKHILCSMTDLLTKAWKVQGHSGLRSCEHTVSTSIFLRATYCWHKLQTRNSPNQSSGLEHPEGAVDWDSLLDAMWHGCWQTLHVLKADACERGYWQTVHSQGLVIWISFGSVGAVNIARICTQRVQRFIADPGTNVMQSEWQGRMHVSQKYDGSSDVSVQQPQRSPAGGTCGREASSSESVGSTSYKSDPSSRRLPSSSTAAERQPSSSDMAGWKGSPG